MPTSNNFDKDAHEYIVQKHLHKLAKANGHTLIICRLTPGEFSAVRWAARAPGGIDAFLKNSIREGVRRVMITGINLRRDCPQFVSEFVAGYEITRDTTH